MKYLNKKLKPLQQSKNFEDQNQNLRQMKHSHNKQLGFRKDRKNLENMQESNLRNMLGNHQNLKC
jgi:hypothetical protein